MASPSATAPDALSPDQTSLVFERFFIGFFFLFPVLLFIYPALPRFNQAVAGLAHDNVINLWSFWHTSNAFCLRDEPLYSTLRLLAPVGSPLALHDMCLLPSFLLTPITALFGVFAGFNCLLILSQLWAGVGTFCLVRHLTHSRLSAAFAAFLLEMSPLLYYRLIDHYTLSYMGFIPFLVYLLLRSLDGPPQGSSRRHGILIGATSVGCFLTSYNIYLFSFFALAFLWCAFFIAALRDRAYDRLRRLLVILLWAGLICGCFLYVWGVVSPVQEARFGGIEPRVKTGNASGILVPYLLVPHPQLWGFARWVTQWPKIAGDANAENFCYLGYVPLLLFALGSVALFRRRRWLAVALLLFIAFSFDLALGYGSVNPAASDAAARVNPLLLFPRFIALPVMDQARVPARWIFPCFTLFICLAGCGTHRLLEKLAPRYRTGALIVMTGLVSVEYAHIPTPTNDFAPPAAYQVMGVADKSTAMIVEYPQYMVCGVKGEYGVSWDMARLSWSIRHQYRIPSAYLSRIHTWRLREEMNQPFLRDLWIIQGNAPYLTDAAHTDLATVRRWLQLNDVRFVTLDKRVDIVKPLEYLTTNNLAVPVRDDGRYVVCKIVSQPPS